MRFRLSFLVLVLLAVLVPAGSASAQASKPAVTTGPIADPMPTGATVTGTVNPRGRVTTVNAEYGADGKFNRRTANLRLEEGTRNVPVRIALSGLKPLTKYSYRLLGRNRNGLRLGRTRTFTTPRVPASVTLSAAPAVVTFGDPVFLSGAVGGTGAGGSSVQPQLAEFPFTAGFSPAGNALIAAPDGTFGLTVEPRLTTQYRVEAVVDKKAALSPIFTVAVAPRVRLSIRRGSRASFSGSIAPGGDAVVRLKRISSTGKRTTVSRTTTRGSDKTTYRFPRRRILSTRDYVVTVTPAGGAFVEGASRVRTVRRTRRR